MLEAKTHLQCNELQPIVLSIIQSQSSLLGRLSFVSLVHTGIVCQGHLPHFIAKDPWNIKAGLTELLLAEPMWC